MTEQWYPREYQDGDEPAIVELHKLVYGEEVSLDWWTWQYRRNPAGPPIIVLAEAAEGLVGQFSMIPLRMKVDDEISLGSLSFNVMVHPNYRGQGMFTKLGEQAIKLAVQSGIDFGYAFPNANSHRGFIAKLGWSDMYRGIPLWLKPLNLENVVRSYAGGNRLAAKLIGKPAQGIVKLFYRSKSSAMESNIREVTSFDERFDVLWSTTSLDHRIIRIRNEAYLTWRYLERPGQSYTILTAEKGGRLRGYAVLRCMERFNLKIGFLVDMMSPREEPQVSGDLIAAAVRHFESRRMDMVGCLMLPSTYHSRNLRQAGFFVVPNRLLPQDMNLVVGGFVAQDRLALLKDQQNWFITWSDHDVI